MPLVISRQACDRTCVKALSRSTSWVCVEQVQRGREQHTVRAVVQP